MAKDYSIIGNTKIIKFIISRIIFLNFPKFFLKKLNWYKVNKFIYIYCMIDQFFNSIFLKTINSRQYKDEMIRGMQKDILEYKMHLGTHCTYIYTYPGVKCMAVCTVYLCRPTIRHS